MAALYAIGGWALLTWSTRMALPPQQLREILTWIAFAGAFGAWLRWRRVKSVLSAARAAALWGLFGAVVATAIVVLMR